MDPDLEPHETEPKNSHPFGISSAQDADPLHREPFDIRKGSLLQAQDEIARDAEISPPPIDPFDHAIHSESLHEKPQIQIRSHPYRRSDVSFYPEHDSSSRDIFTYSSEFGNQYILLADRDLCIKIDYVDTLGGLFLGPSHVRHLAKFLRMSRYIFFPVIVATAFSFLFLVAGSPWSQNPAFTACAAISLFLQIVNLLVLQPVALKYCFYNFETCYLLLNILLVAITLLDMFNWIPLAVMFAIFLCVAYSNLVMMDSWPISFNLFQQNTKEILSFMENREERSSSSISSSESTYNLHAAVPRRRSSITSSIAGFLGIRGQSLRRLSSANNRKFSGTARFSSKMELVSRCKIFYQTFAKYIRSVSGLRSVLLHRFFVASLNGSGKILLLVLSSFGPLSLYLIVQTDPGHVLSNRKIYILHTFVTTRAIFASACLNILIFTMRRLFVYVYHPLKFFSIKNRLYRIPLIKEWIPLLQKPMPAIASFHKVFQDGVAPINGLVEQSILLDEAVESNPNTETQILQTQHNSELNGFVQDEIDPALPPNVGSDTKKRARVSFSVADSSSRPFRSFSQTSMISPPTEPASSHPSQASRSANHIASKYIAEDMQLGPEKPEPEHAFQGADYSFQEGSEVFSSLDARGSLQQSGAGHERDSSTNSHKPSFSFSVVGEDGEESRPSNSSPENTEQRPSMLRRKSSVPTIDRIAYITTPLGESYRIDSSKLLCDLVLTKSMASLVRSKSALILRFMNPMSVLIIMLVMWLITRSNSVSEVLGIPIFMIGGLQRFLVILLFSKEALRRCLRVFESWFLLVNSLVFLTSLSDYLQWSGIRVYGGIVFMLMSYLGTIFADARPIPNAIFKERLADLSQCIDEKRRPASELACRLYVISHLLRLKFAQGLATSSRQNWANDKSRILDDELYIQTKDNRREKWGEWIHARYNLFKDMSIVPVIEMFGLIFFQLYILIIIQLDSAPDRYVRIVSTSIGDWKTSSITQAAAINLVIFFCRRLWGYIDDPLRSMCYDKRVVRIPLIPEVGGG